MAVFPRAPSTAVSIPVLVPKERSSSCWDKQVASCTCVCLLPEEDPDSLQQKHKNFPQLQCWEPGLNPCEASERAIWLLELEQKGPVCLLPSGKRMGNLSELTQPCATALVLDAWTERNGLWHFGGVSLEKMLMSSKLWQICSRDAFPLRVQPYQL